MAKERRKHKRASLEVPLDMQSPEAGRRGFSAKTMNLSAGGFYCKVPFFIPVLTKLRMSMVIPVQDAAGRENDHVITCGGMVVRTLPEKEQPTAKSYEIGCFFTDIEDYDRLVIEQYLSERGITGK